MQQNINFPTNSSEKHSDSESMAGAAGARKPKVKGQQGIRTSKTIGGKLNHIKFDGDDPVLIKHFEKIVSDRRLKNASQLKLYLEKFYQRPIADHIVTILSPKFENFQNQVQNQKYYEII